MSTSSGDEGFDSTARSGTGGAIGITSLGAIIQSLNKRYEVYQRRRTAMTPFPSPMVPTLGVPPTPHSILGDSAVIAGGSHHLNSHNTTTTATAAAPGGSKSHNTRPSSGSHSVARRYETPRESIVPPHTRPAPYWEERELYICAEDLCCYLNGGINYRVLCEQYQRALEVLLTLVREDVHLCASGGLDVLPGGATVGILAKLRTLLKESVKLLDESGVDVPPRLAAAIEHLPTQLSHPSTAVAPSAGAGSGSRGAAASAAAALATSPAVGNTGVGLRPSNSSMMSNGRLASLSASPAAGVSAAASPNLSGAGSAAVGVVSMLAPATGAVNYSAGPSPVYLHHGLAPVPPTSSQPQPAARRPVSGNTNNGDGSGDGRRPYPPTYTPDNAYLAPHYTGTAYGSNGGSRSTAQTPIASPASHLRRHASNPPAIAEPRYEEGGSHENGGSILRGGSLGPNSAAPTPTKAGGGGSGGVGLARKRVSGAPAERRHPHPPATSAAAAGLMHRGHTGNTSPIPSAPPSRSNDSAMQVESGTDHGSTVTYPNVLGAVAGMEPEAAGAGAEDVHDAAAASPGRARLRRLEELYGELYAMDGMALLTDALGVVFTREYDQGPLQQYKHGFTAFQRDVNGKVTPALQSYEALQLRITDLAPLRSSYLASCLVYRVRPNNTVLDHLKRIDHDRSAEAMLLGGLHLGDRGVAAVVEGVVPRLYRLRRLDLSENDITDAALDALLRATRYHPALEHLSLSRNPITDAALPHLLRIVQTLPRLSVLSLQSCAMKPTTRTMVETELAEPGTYAVPLPAPRRGSLTSLRQGSVAATAGMPAKYSASAPRAGGTASTRSMLPLLSADRQHLLPQSAVVRAESVPTHFAAASRRLVSQDAAAKPSYPRGLGVALDPIDEAASLSPQSLSTKSAPDANVGAAAGRK